MNIRSKILLSVMAGAIIAALASVEISVSGAKSVIVIAAIAAAFCAVAVVVGLFIADSIVKPLDTAAGVGGAAVKRAAEAVKWIKASSDNNAKIIKTINYMAMRARCLAFNATIEAARAGEAGEGFAIVAGDMRNFAARCAVTAGNITDMIEESANDVDDGVKSTEEAVNAVGKLVDRIDGDINCQAGEHAVPAGGFAPGGGGGPCAAEQRGQSDLSARQKRYAASPYKKIYSAATLAFWAPMRPTGTDGAFTIDDCEMWR